FQAALLQRWLLPHFMCPFCPFVQALSVNVSVFTLTAIAIDRHRAIITPLSPYTSHCWAQDSSQNKRAWAIVPTLAQCALGTSHTPLNCFADSEIEQNGSPMAHDPAIPAISSALPASEHPCEVPTPQENDDFSVPENQPDAHSAPPQPELDPDMLSALGESTDDTPEFGEKINENLTKLWLPLLKKPMTRDNKDKIQKEYLVPDNCRLLQAPKINVEIAAAVPDMVRNRDKNLAAMQQQLGSGISAVNRAMDILLKGADANKIQAMKHLSNGCRILCDLHALSTQNRIKLITPSLDKTFLQIIQEAERDETLFVDEQSSASLGKLASAPSLHVEQGGAGRCPQADSGEHPADVLSPTTGQDSLHAQTACAAGTVTQLEIYTDASSSGWGAVCGEDKVNGTWKSSERESHINYLELLAVHLGLKSFARDMTNCAILLRVDNTTAISYVNRMGGVQFPHLNELSRSIWQWCEKRHIWIYASYINTKENIADAESRKAVNPDTEWELSDNAFKTIVQRFGKPEIDLFASRSNAKCSNFISWKPDPDALAVDAFTTSWRSKFFYAFPPFARLPPPAQGTYPGCREALQQSFSRRGSPPEALTLMLASLSDNTLKQYDVTYKLWWQFSVLNNIDAFEPPKTAILTFLSRQFSKNCAYGTLNSHRSALSLLLGNSMGSDDCVKRLLKGAYKKKPNGPKYNYTWDPQVVLNHISHWYPNTSLNLEKITKKLVTLLAICTAHRVQTLSLIKVENIIASNNGFKIGITDVIKTSAAGREQPVLFLPFFRENISICPATTLRDYIFVTKNKRADSVGNLLLTYRPPHRAATSQTISRWIKNVLSESGVDVTVFSAHSTRHAATSPAARAGVGVAAIRRAAGWTDNSTSFARFYNRPTSDEGFFARAVCLPRNNP
ncbi:hypothetical protein MSG28_007543, partial [Choristoneura fumiferana]